jgi:hypothetical protein
VHSVLIVLVLLFPSLAFADAVTLDFSTGTIDSSVGGETFSYTEQGMNVSVYGPPSSFENYFFVSGTLMQTYINGAGVVFTATNGGLFDLMNVQLTGAGTPQYFLSSSNDILYTTSTGLLTFPTDGWTGLTSFTMFTTQILPFPLQGSVNIDNVTVNMRSVPEPPTFMFVALGLLCMVGAHRWALNSRM